MDDQESLRDQAARYRRMLKDIDDPKTRAVLVKLVEECDAKVRKASEAAVSELAKSRHDNLN